MLHKVRCVKHVRKLGEVLAPMTTQISAPNFEEDFQKHFIPTNFFQKAALGIGSAAISILNPTRAELIAAMGETTGRIF